MNYSSTINNSGLLGATCELTEEALGQIDRAVVKGNRKFLRYQLSRADRDVRAQTRPPRDYESCNCTDKCTLLNDRKKKIK